MRRSLRLIGGVVAAVIALCGSVASAARPVAWRIAGQLDATSVSAPSCPSSALCVAVTAAGDVIASAAPFAGARSWVSEPVDPAGDLVAVACASVAQCVAVGARGEVVTSTDPTGGALGWQASQTVAGSLTDVACPTTMLCVATTGDGQAVNSQAQAALAGTVLLTTNPTGGTDAWMREQVEASLGPECGKYGPWEGCGNAMTHVSCASASVCVATDGYGDAVASEDPAAEWGPPVSLGGPQVSEYDGLSCPSDGLCIGECPAGYGFYGAECPSGNYGAENVFTWDPQTGSRGTFTAISSDQLTGLWCTSASVCFTAGSTGELYATADPVGHPARWILMRAATSPSTADPIIGVSCQPAGSCLAIDRSGDLLNGSAPPTSAQLSALIRAALTPRGSAATTARVTARGSFRAGFSPPVPGRLIVRWSLRSAGHTLVIAAGRLQAKAARTRMTITLTRRGINLLGHARHAVTLSSNASFTPIGGATTDLHWSITLARSLTRPQPAARSGRQAAHRAGNALSPAVAGCSRLSAWSMPAMPLRRSPGEVAALPDVRPEGAICPQNR